MEIYHCLSLVSFQTRGTQTCCADAVHKWNHTVKVNVYRAVQFKNLAYQLFCWQMLFDEMTDIFFLDEALSDVGANWWMLLKLV